MTFLKWIAIVIATGYLAGLVVLYVRQRDMLFPIPPVGRTLPDAAGLPEAEEHVLITPDGENVIIWHVPARPGRPVILYFPGNGDFLAGLAGRFFHRSGKNPWVPTLQRLLAAALELDHFFLARGCAAS